MSLRPSLHNPYDPAGNNGPGFRKEAVQPLAGDTTAQKKTRKSPTSLSENGLKFLRAREGFDKKIRKEGHDPETIGYGHKLTEQEKKKGEYSGTISRTDAEELFKKDVAIAEAAINRLVKVPLTQNQYDALVSLVYNIGATKLAGFKLMKKLNSGDYKGAATEFLDINKASKNGAVIPGLTNRRKLEYDLFNKH